MGVAFIDRSPALAGEFMATVHEDAEEWQDVALLANADLWLTAAETRTVTGALAAVLEPYRSRAFADRPNGMSRAGQEHGLPPPGALTGTTDTPARKRRCASDSAARGPNAVVYAGRRLSGAPVD